VALSSEGRAPCQRAPGSAALLALLFALGWPGWAARAHTAVATRTLRLQLEKDGISGLLSYRLPQGKGTQLLLAVPQGLAPGDPRGVRSENGEALALRLAPEALRGLRVRLGDGDAAAVPPELREARARQDVSGAIEALFLLRVQSRATVPGETLRVEVETGLPLPVTLIAPSGIALELLEGAGRAQPGGLSLHPRSGAPCKVRIKSVGPLP